LVRKMEKNRHGRHSRDKSKKSKKRKNREANGSSSSGGLLTCSKPLVEYSDVSSEDLSGPEAGEIQSGEESLSLSDDGEIMHRSGRHRYARLEEEYYLARSTQLVIGHSPGTPNPKHAPPRKTRSHHVILPTKNRNRPRNPEIFLHDESEVMSTICFRPRFFLERSRHLTPIYDPNPSQG
jgi:hypothetical protein